MRSVQPRGPYFLGGHSFGGQVAYEIARQLQAAGDEVGVLVIFDTNAPHTQERPVGLEHDDDARWLCEIATVIEHLSGRKQDVSYEELRALEPGARLASFRASLIEGGWLPEETTASQLSTFVDVYKANIRADYRPRDPIPTRIALFKARDPMAGGEPHADPTASGTAWGWGELADGKVLIYHAAGNHLTMMTEPHVNGLAEQLRECLDRHRESSWAARHRDGLEVPSPQPGA
jgi:thioesterase domain-containing protein